MSRTAEPHEPLETLRVKGLHASTSVAVHDVCCRPHGKERGPEEQPLTHQIVFPRRGLFEFHARGEKVIADANRVLFFTRGEPYRVAHPAGAGDDCTVFAFDDAILRDALEHVDPRWCATAGGISQPFRFVHGFSDERVFWAHERLRRAALFPPRQGLAIDEAAVELLTAVLESTYRGRGVAPQPAQASTSAAHRELVHQTSLFLATAFGDDASLADVGRALHASPFHLARLFRRESGVTIHQYRHRLRLRAALTRIADGEANLSDLALELGFSSHSHLTDAFRLAFGLSPADCRRTLDVRGFRQLSKNLEVGPRAKT